MKTCVSFDKPEHGWIGIRLQSGDQVLEDAVSYVPFDSFDELATALSMLAQGTQRAAVHWSAEPYFYEFQYFEADGHITLTIMHHPSAPNVQKRLAKCIFTASGSFNEICRPFWKAVCDLRGRYSDEQLSRGWQRPFPGEKFDRLGEQIRLLHAQRVSSRKSCQERVRTRFE